MFQRFAQSPSGDPPQPEATETSDASGMARARRRRQPPAVRHYLPVLATLVSGVLFSLGAFVITRAWEDERLRGQFTERAQRHVSALSREIQGNLLILQAPRSLFVASENVTREEFRTFTAPFVRDESSVRAWGWIPRVTRGQRSEHEAAVQRDAVPGYEIREMDADRRLVRAADRDEYFPVCYTEPCRGNETASGFDLRSEATRRRALELARDTGLPTASAAIPLIEPFGHRLGFLVLLPLYEGPSETVPQRREHLSGFVCGVFFVSGVMEDAFGDFHDKDVRASLYDRTEPQEPELLGVYSGRTAGLVWEPSAADEASIFEASQADAMAGRPFWDRLGDPTLRLVKELDVAGRRWAIVCSPEPGFLAMHRSWHSWMALAAGVLLSTLLMLLVNRGVQRTVAVERLVRERTRALRESEEKARAVFDKVQVGIVLVDAETHLIADVNPVAAAMIGAARQEIIGKPCHSHICPATRETCPALETAQVCNADCSLVTATGQALPILKTAVLVTLSGRRFVLESFVDISGRRQAEEAVRASEEKLRTISEAALDAVIMIDPMGRIIHWNPAAERIFGYSAAEILDRPVHEMLAPPRYREKASRQWELFRHSGQGNAVGRALEMEALRKDGSQFPIEISLSKIPMNGGWGGVALLRDISSRKQAELELNRRTLALESANVALRDAKQAAEAANEAKSQFLTNMSHELRTPLHGILSFAAFGVKRLVSEDATRDEQAACELREYFELIQKSGAMLLNLVNDLLDLAKLESGHMEFEFKPLNLESLVLASVDELQSLARDRGLTIETRGQGDAMAFADSARMMQVLRNLLGNAIKFSPPDGKIEVELSDRKECVEVRVLDRGPGIPEEELEAIFDKFIQSSKTRTGAGGTGLGLAICREILDAHHGRIWAENRPDGGAVLSFLVPRPPVPAVEPLILASDVTLMDTGELMPGGAPG